jgi:hypothetical protein
MGYTLDLRQLPLDKYLAILRSQNLLPGRRILLDDITLNFQKMKTVGITSVYELKGRLSTPSKLASFSSATDIAGDYLIILKRELGSLEQKPVLLTEFSGFNRDTIAHLQNIDIKTSKDFFDLHTICGSTESAAAKTGIGVCEINELWCLCNLVRVNGVGPAAARTMFEGGYRSIADVAGADAEEMLDRITEVNIARQYYQAKLGIKDMQFAIDAARLILDIEGQ